MFDDTRIHGVPASGVRFGELSMVRGSYSLNIFDQYRLDLFLERAWGRTGRSTRLAADNRPRHGGELPGPKNTMFRADFGRSLLPAGTGTSGHILSRS